MPVVRYVEAAPKLGEGVDLAEDAVVAGAVTIAGPARLEASAVLRGDQNRIEVGPRFRIGQRSTLHVELHTPTLVGAGVWLADHAVVHACTLGDNVRIEDRGLVLSGARVGMGSIVAAGALVTENAEFPADSYLSGTPARRVRETTAEERAETERRLAELFGA
jgi:carbonic anhydrase/acetyltransferase-like protein (isoleucine patch superfamily)